MTKLKTQPTLEKPWDYLKTIENPQKRKDCQVLLSLFKTITGQDPVMWGKSIVGFGHYHYRSASGREGDWFLTGFAPRQHGLSIYLLCGLDDSQEILTRLGKHKRGKGCLNIRSLKDVDLTVLEEFVRENLKRKGEDYVC